MVLRRGEDELLRYAPSSIGTPDLEPLGVPWMLALAVRTELVQDTDVRFELQIGDEAPIDLGVPKRRDRLGSRSSADSSTSTLVPPEPSRRQDGREVRAARRASRLRLSPAVRLALVCALVGGLGAAVALALLRPQAEASALISVTPLRASDANFDGLPLIRFSGDAGVAISTAADVLGQPAAAGAAAARIGDGWTMDRVLAAITISPNRTVGVVAITARASSGHTAVALADAYANAALVLHRRQLLPAIGQQLATAKAQLALLGPGITPASNAAADRVATLAALQRSGETPDLHLIRLATASATRSGLHSAALVLLGLIAGFLLGLLGDLAASGFRRRDAGASELSRLTGLPVLARVGSASPGSSAFSESIAGLETMLSTSGRGKPEVIALVSGTRPDWQAPAARTLALHAARRGTATVLLGIDRAHPGPPTGGGGSIQRSPDVAPLLRPLARSVLAGVVRPRTADELLTVISHLTDAVELVVLDAPWLSENPAALTAAAAADVALLLVTLPLDSSHDPRATLARLRQVQAEPLGIVV